MKRYLAAALLYACVTVPATAQLVTVLNLPGIPGESEVPAYEDRIDVLSWTQSVSNVNQTPVVLPLEFVYYVDTASPKLVEAALLGSMVGPATMTVLITVNGSLEFSSEVKLNGAKVVSVTASGSDGGGRPLETVRLTCSSFVYSYVPRLPDGSPGPVVDTAGNCGN